MLNEIEMYIIRIGIYKSDGERVRIAMYKLNLCLAKAFCSYFQIYSSESTNFACSNTSIFCVIGRVSSDQRVQVVYGVRLVLYTSFRTQIENSQIIFCLHMIYGAYDFLLFVSLVT